jgi:hypothetical protein
MLAKSLDYHSCPIIWNTSIPTILPCTECHVSHTDIVNNFTKYGLDLATTKTCSGVNVFSCCNDPAGVSSWNPQTTQFECTKCKLPYEYKTRFTGIDPNDLQTKPSGCNHEWKKYTGLKEEFEFCGKCDVKRG